MQFCILFIKTQKSTIHLYTSLYFFWHKTCECMMGRDYTGIPQDLISSVLLLLVLSSVPLSCLATLQDLSLCVCVHVCVRVFIYERVFPVCMVCVLLIFLLITCSSYYEWCRYLLCIKRFPFMTSNVWHYWLERQWASWTVCTACESVREVWLWERKSALLFTHWATIASSRLLKDK